MPSFSFSDFALELQRAGRLSEADAAELWLDAASAAVDEVLGPGSGLVLELGAGQVRIFQVLTVRALPSAPSELSLLDARRVDPAVNEGDLFRVPVHFTRNPAEKAEREHFAALAERLPVPLYLPALWPALDRHLNTLACAWFPAPRPTLGTIWERLSRPPLHGEHCAVTVRWAGATVSFQRTHPECLWFEIDVTLEVHRNGTVEPWIVTRGGNDAEVLAWLSLPATPDDAPLGAVLEGLAATLADKHPDQLGNPFDELMDALVARPASDSVWQWCCDLLREQLASTPAFALPDGQTAHLRLVEPAGPEGGVRGFGSAGVGVDLVVLPAGLTGEAWLSLGALPAAALSAPMSDALRTDLGVLVDRFGPWLQAMVTSHVHVPWAMGANLLDGLEVHLPLLEVLWARVVDGPAGPVPMPPFEDADLLGAASRLQAPSAAQTAAAQAALGGRTPIALFDVQGTVLALCDDLGRSFPYCDAWVGLLPQGAAAFHTVLLVDVWNPASKAVVDGDAFAFLRFRQWLRGALRHGALDTHITYAPNEDEDEDEEYEDEPLQALPTPPLSLALSDWLLFGLPDTGDAHLLDWRRQWNVVFAGTGIYSCFSGIYGMGPEARQAEQAGIAAWRSFLKQLDPRFPAYGPGSKGPVSR